MISKDFGQFIVLIIGDSHIPRRAKKVPESILNNITDFVKKHGKFDQTFCTGDLVKTEVFPDFLQSVTKRNEFLAVQGNMDYFERIDNPLELRYSFKDLRDLKIGLIHGHQISPRGDTLQLTSYARKMGVNILISGHTHADSIKMRDNILLLNPGSCVGAWSFVASGIPSYIIMELNKEEDNSILIRIHIYKEKGGIFEENIVFHFKNGRFLD
jgi:putative phosphoesterase